MGGGLPAAAFGGRAELMAQLAPSGPVYQAGTLSGNPVAVAAGLATLRRLHRRVYARVDAAAAPVGGWSRDALSEQGVPHRVQTAGNLFSVFFTEDAGARLRRRPAAARRRVLPRVLPAFLPPSVRGWFVRGV